MDADLPRGVRWRRGLLTFKRTINGNTYAFAFGHASVEAAKRELDSFYLDPDHFTARRRAREGGRTTSEKAVNVYLVHLRDVRRASPVYRVNVERVIRRLLTFGPKRMGEWSPSHIERYVASRGVGPSTIATELKQLKAWFKFAIEREWLQKSPAEGVRGPKPVLEVTDRRRSVPLEHLLQLDLGAAERDALLCLWGTGLRVSELWRVQAEDIHPDRLHVRCSSSEPTKGRRARSVPVAGKMVEVLKRSMGGLPAPQDVARALERALASTDLPRFTMQSLRHSRITAWVDAGHPLPRVQRWAGHANITTTMNYVRVSEAAPEDVLQGML